MIRRMWLRLTGRDPRDDDPYRPNWQALVDAVDHAADIAYSPFMSGPRRHIIKWRGAAQTIADFYASTWFRDEIDAELNALDTALLLYPDDVFGRQP